MIHTSLLVGMTLLNLGQASAPPADGAVVITGILALDEEAMVAAQEAGKILEQPIRDGMEVAKDQLLARIDDTIPAVQKKVSEYKMRVSEEQANSTIGVEYATAAFNVAYSQWKQAKEANEKVKGSVPEATVREYLLRAREMELSIAKAEMERRIAALELDVSRAERDAAEVNLAHRQVTSPLDGQVVKVFKHVGEWVQMGDPIARVVRVNRLRIQGEVNFAKHAPGEILGRDVTVRAELTRGRPVDFPGKVVFVDPTIQSGGNYSVRAEIQNREEGGQWLLREGMEVTMTIHLK